MTPTASPSTRCEVTVNGSRIAVEGPSHRSALDLLRDQGLTGSKEGCAEGECGACAILVARPDGDGTRWTSVNACLVPAAALDGQEVVTAEGLGAPDDLHPVQQEMAVLGGSQCGYCTPGFICSMAAEYYRPGRTAESEENAAVDPLPVDVVPIDASPAARGAAGDGAGGAPSDSGDGAGARPCPRGVQAVGEPEPDHGPNGFDLHALSGNLCRCTGYRPIRDAAYALGSPGDDDPLAARRGAPAPPPAPTDISRPDGRFRRPASLGEALEILREDPETMIVAGSTDWGVEVGIKGRRAESVLAIDRLAELRGIERSADRVEIGAAVTLSEIERELGAEIPLLGQLIPQFASRLIRNGATIGGNLGTGSPIGDTPPALLALDASLVLASASGEREVPLTDYFTDYRKSVRRPDELIASIRIPLPLAPLTAFHKVSKRRFDDISSVAIAYALTVEDGVIVRARIGLGGVAATPLRATATEKALTGMPWTEETVRETACTLAGEGTPMDDLRASARYRSAMLGTSLERLYAEQAGRDAVRAVREPAGGRSPAASAAEPETPGDTGGDASAPEEETGR